MTCDWSSGSCVERAAQLARGLAADRLDLGPLLGRARLERAVVVVVELRRLPAAAPQRVDRAVADDAEHPGADAAAGAVEAGVASARSRGRPPG